MAEDNDITDAAIAAAAHKSTMAGAGAAVIGWVTSSEFGVLVGFIIGVAGLLINWYYKARADKRATAEFAARMKAMTGKTVPPSQL